MRNCVSVLATPFEPCFFLVVNVNFVIFVAEAKVGDSIGVASWVNMTRTLFDVLSILDDGGSGNILVISYT